MISAERMKSVRIAPLILSRSKATRSTLGIGQRLDDLGVVGVVLGLGVQQLVRQLLHALEAEEGAADHHQRDHRPGHEGAQQQRGRHQDRLVEHRALGDRPDHRKLALGIDARDLLRVEREVVAKHAGGLLGGDLGHHRDVVEHGGDVVEQGEQTGGHVWAFGREMREL